MSSKQMSFAEFLDILKDNLGFDFDIRKDDFNNRFKLQKYGYFAKLCGLQLPAIYTIYHRGPYSSTLANLYYNTNLYEKTKFDCNDFDAKKFFSAMQNKNERWLELASTAHRIYHLKKNSIQDPQSLRSNVAKHVFLIKGCNQKEVITILEELEKYDLLT